MNPKYPIRPPPKEKRYHAKRHLTFIGTSDPSGTMAATANPGKLGNMGPESEWIFAFFGFFLLYSRRHR